MLMSEQSFCDRKLFIVSLSASWNPHYYQSVWAFVLLHCRTLLIKVSTQTLIFSWNWLRLSILSTNSKTLKYHKQITSTLNKFSNIFQIYIILYPWLKWASNNRAWLNLLQVFLCFNIWKIRFTLLQCYQATIKFK